MQTVFLIGIFILSVLTISDPSCPSTNYNNSARYLNLLLCMLLAWPNSKKIQIVCPMNVLMLLVRSIIHNTLQTHSNLPYHLL